MRQSVIDSLVVLQCVRKAESELAFERMTSFAARRAPLAKPVAMSAIVAPTPLRRAVRVAAPAKARRGDPHGSAVFCGSSARLAPAPLLVCHPRALGPPAHLASLPARVLTRYRRAAEQARRGAVCAAAAPAAAGAAKAEKPLNIVFVSAEVAPWSKTGGLGDVVRGRTGAPLS